jgi:TrmH family RNA methyltransferase
MPHDPIISPGNRLIKDLARLRKRRGRDAAGRFLIEGAREIDRARIARIPLNSVLYAPEMLSEPGRALVAALEPQLDTIELSPKAFAKLSNRQRPDGVVAVATWRPYRLEDLVLPANPLLLVAEGIEKPGNLGAMLRSADGAGANAVVVPDPSTDLANPNVIRASQGAVFSIPTAVASAAESMDFLATRGIAVVGLDPHASTDLWDIDLSGPTAIAVGSEAHGLSRAISARSASARVPMKGAADSLNASVAAALALYEAVRQRS